MLVAWHMPLINDYNVKLMNHAFAFYFCSYEWLHEKYGLNVWDTIQINQLFFMLITSCMTDMHVPDPEYNQ